MSTHGPLIARAEATWKPLSELSRQEFGHGDPGTTGTFKDGKRCTKQKKVPPDRHQIATSSEVVHPATTATITLAVNLGAFASLRPFGASKQKGFRRYAAAWQCPMHAATITEFFVAEDRPHGYRRGESSGDGSSKMIGLHTKATSSGKPLGARRVLSYSQFRLQRLCF